MPILNKKDLLGYIAAGQLVLNPHRDGDGTPTVEPASYDLRAGIVLWKEEDSSRIELRDFDEGKEAWQRPVVTLRPGQMVFVITHEELKLTETVCATVYSRNKLQKENILALNAGHIDPGFEGPIMIRLINLSAVPWSLRLGEAIFTAVFHTVKDGDGLEKHRRITKKETLDAAMKTAADAFSNPFHDLYKDQFRRQLDEYYAKVETRLRDEFSKEFLRKNKVGEILVIAVVAFVALLATATRIPWATVLNWWKWVLHLK
jgi:deoxycytidine triphosphate deaminase